MNYNSRDATAMMKNMTEMTSDLCLLKKIKNKSISVLSKSNINE